LDDWAATLQALSATLRKALGGTSGPLYAIGLLCAAQSLNNDPAQFGLALQAAIDGIARVGGARHGDRTMLDALIPAAQVLLEDRTNMHIGTPALMLAVHAAHQGTQDTAQRVAKQGRSSYIGERAMGHMDPGARAVVIWLQAIAEALTDQPS
jgi:dihydroxyacetone kinase